MDINSQNIAVLFRAIRKFNGLYQADFAKMLGVTQGTISKIESGLLSPELILWFKFLKVFNIKDPYCFTYKGVEFGSDVFQGMATKTSRLAPGFVFDEKNCITTVRKVRPIFDYLMANNQKLLNKFLEKNSIAIELFYILNHPLNDEIVNLLFEFLDSHKFNSQFMNNVDFSFESTLGGFTDELQDKVGSSSFFSDILTVDGDFFVYENSSAKNQYFVSLLKKDFGKIKNLNSFDSILNYNLLFPYRAVKAIKGSESVGSPMIVQLKENQRWRVDYVS
ncbi:MAG: helix-turn-helix transcriptional regulator [Bacteriovoracaceae bacterium]|nr:helix-turn-helix transcriptional regulator [Bacteriovoracaceae bacterium]